MPSGSYWSYNEDQFLYDQLARGVDISRVVPPKGRTLRDCRCSVVMLDFPNNMPLLDLIIAEDFVSNVDKMLISHLVVPQEQQVYCCSVKGVKYPILWPENTHNLISSQGISIPYYPPVSALEVTSYGCHEEEWMRWIDWERLIEV